MFNAAQQIILRITHFSTTLLPYCVISVYFIFYSYMEAFCREAELFCVYCSWLGFTSKMNLGQLALEMSIINYLLISCFAVIL